MKILKLIILALIVTSSKGQVPYLNYKTADGFISNIIYDVKEDSKGFLWIITDKGIIKYSGTSIKTITKKNGLKSNDNYKILIDKNDIVWTYSNIEVATINSDLTVKHIFPTNNYYSAFLIDEKKENILFPIKTAEYSWKHIILNKDSVIEVNNLIDINKLINQSKKYKSFKIRWS
jgi:ligand-binding sensor domain-containing protein